MRTLWDLPQIWFGKVSLRKQTEICVYKRKSCIDTVESTQGGETNQSKGLGVWAVGGGWVHLRNRKKTGREGTGSREAREEAQVRDAPMGQEEVFIFRVYLNPPGSFKQRSARVE